MSGIYHLGY